QRGGHLVAPPRRVRRALKANRPDGAPMRTSTWRQSMTAGHHHARLARRACPRAARSAFTVAVGRGTAQGARRRGRGAGPGVAGWLRLAASPAFATMALLTGVFGGPPDVLCSSAASPLTGMVPMYLLMSASHLAPWLKLISGQERSNVQRPGCLKTLRACSTLARTT